MNIKYLLPILVLFSSVSEAEELCLKSIQFPKKYSSFWVEEFYASGRFTGILDEDWLIDKQAEVSKRISLANKELKVLMAKGIPEDEGDQVDYMKRFFALKKSLKEYREELPYYVRNMETTEKLLIYKFALAANAVVTQEISNRGECLQEEAYIERLMVKTESLISEISNKRL